MIARWSIRQSAKDLIERLINIAIWLLGLLFAVMIVFPGLTPTRALGGLGLISIAVGFAFRDMFENFSAGILLLWRFPCEDGDFIECEGITGRVEETTIRMTKIRCTSGELIIVPNSFLFKNPVQVLTSEERRRVSIVAGIAYDEDIATAPQMIERTMRGCETVDQERPVQVFPKKFGASSVDIEVAWWTGSKPVDIRRSRAEVITAPCRRGVLHALDFRHKD